MEPFSLSPASPLNGCQFLDEEFQRFWHRSDFACAWKNFTEQETTAISVFNFIQKHHNVAYKIADLLLNHFGHVTSTSDCQSTIGLLLVLLLIRWLWENWLLHLFNCQWTFLVLLFACQVEMLVARQIHTIGRQLEWASGRVRLDHSADVLQI